MFTFKQYLYMLLVGQLKERGLLSIFGEGKNSIYDEIFRYIIKYVARSDFFLLTYYGKKRFGLIEGR